jgi:hypothetical protein
VTATGNPITGPTAGDSVAELGQKWGDAMKKFAVQKDVPVSHEDVRGMCNAVGC